MLALCRDGQIGAGIGGRPGQHEIHGGGEHGPAALEHTDTDAAGGGIQFKAQHGRGCLAGDTGRPQHDQGGGAVFRRQLESAQGGHVGFGQPQQDDLATTRSQCLAAGPAGMGRAFGLHQQQSPEGDARCGEGRCIGQTRRRDAHPPAPGGNVA